MSTNKRRETQSPPRREILSRLLAATFGSYAVTSLAMSLLALALALSSIPGSNNADRVLIATLLSFVLCPVIVILVFSTRSALRAWVGLGLTAVLMSAIIVTLKMALL